MESGKEKKTQQNITFISERISTHLLKAIIVVNARYTHKVYKKTLRLYQRETLSSGFQKQKTPTEYVREHYKIAIENCMKNFLFKHVVLDYLMDQIRSKKMSLANYPRLINVVITPQKEIKFSFKLSIAAPLELKEWKHFVFRAPKRKRYKDLDKQVDLFMKREIIGFKNKKIDTVEEEDWVYFSATLSDEKTNQVEDEQLKSRFWIKINNKYVSKPFQALLIGKRTGDSFVTNSLPIRNDFSEEFENNRYSFLIKINAITKGEHFSIDSFKNIFKLKSKNEVHRKLIETFSYRNDISQRKSIIEELFHLLLSKHRFEIPKHFIIRRQEDILFSIRKHPDYQVYKQENDFLKQVGTLAEKQLKEEILMDQISYSENVKIDTKDLQHYLHLFNNSRLKEFVYFKPLLEKIEDTSSPIQAGLLTQSALREKTLNHVIYVLTQ